MDYSQKDKSHSGPRHHGSFIHLPFNRFRIICYLPTATFQYERGGHHPWTFAVRVGICTRTFADGPAGADQWQAAGVRGVLDLVHSMLLCHLGIRQSGRHPSLSTAEQHRRLGSSALNNVPASYGDMTTPAKYAPFFTCYGFSAFAGPALGGLIGAFVNERAGWRWNLRHQAIFVAVVTVIGVLFVPETDHPRLKRLHDAKFAVPDETITKKDSAKATWSSKLSSSASSFGAAVGRSIKLPFHWLLTGEYIVAEELHATNPKR